ncbi:hypothetical protein C0J52_04896, partial [Blattella germanica]
MKLQKRRGAVAILLLWTSRNSVGTGSLLPKNTRPTTVQESVPTYFCKNIRTHISLPWRILPAQLGPAVHRGKCRQSLCFTSTTSTTLYMACSQAWWSIDVAAP